MVKRPTVLDRLRRHRDADCGAALVEAAIILPVFLALVGCVYEFGYFLYQEQLATSGVRDAARYLALSADPNSSLIQGDAINLAVSGSPAGGAARVPGWSASDIAISINAVDNSTGTYTGGSTIQIITVSTRFSDSSLGFLSLLGLKRPIISASHQERFVGGSARG
jgi:Flp pilus assembly protein TadG